MRHRTSLVLGCARRNGKSRRAQQQRERRDPCHYSVHVLLHRHLCDSPSKTSVNALEGATPKGTNCCGETRASPEPLAAHPPAVLNRNNHGAARAPLRRQAKRTVAIEQPPARIDAEPRARTVLLRGEFRRRGGDP